MRKQLEVLRARNLGSCLSISLIPLFVLVTSAPAESEKLTLDGISISFESKTFSEVSIEEKEAQPAPKTPFWEVNPARLMFRFHRQPGDEDWTAVRIVALTERAPKILDNDFPDLMKRVATLRELLGDHQSFPALIGASFRSF